MPLTKLPTKQEFKQGLGLSWGVFGNQKSPFPALTRIGRLIEEHDSLPHHANIVARMFFHFMIERASKFVLHHQFHKEKIGGELSVGQVNYLRALHEYVLRYVKDGIGATDANYEQMIPQVFGKEVCDAGQQEDARLRNGDAMYWYSTALEQKMCKLSFRMGKAYRWSFSQDGQGTKEGLNLYDTVGFHDAHMSEYNASLYVMNAKGHILVQGWENGKDLKHSSLMGGAGVLCAGTIRINQGQVIWLTGKSGHYLPTVRNIASLLERLSQYQVDLRNVKVFRENYTPGRIPVDISQWRTMMGLGPLHVPGPKTFEPCDATILLRARAWPGPRQHAQSMHVG
jgi:hypothetical protein